MTALSCGVCGATTATNGIGMDRAMDIGWTIARGRAHRISAGTTSRTQGSGNQTTTPHSDPSARLQYGDASASVQHRGGVGGDDGASLR